jgi:hypothetical protein
MTTEMDPENKKTIILHKAIDKFRKNTDLTADIFPKFHHKDLEADATLKIIWKDIEYLFDVEVKHVINRGNLGGIVRQLDLFKSKGMVITTYVNPQIADELKKLNIPFMDTAGNVHINEPPLFIFIKGNKPAGAELTVIRPRVFRPAGLQILFALLCNPDLENAPYREIAEKASTALGTVGMVMNDLKKLNYLIEMPPGKRRLVRKKDLLNRWITAYPEQLRPKLLIGLYRTENRDWWKNANLHGLHILWGGEVAAARLTEHIRPQNVTVYTDKPVGEFLLKYRIRQDPQGDIEILRMFWNFKMEWPHKNMVPPLLTYADLLATGEARNIETARILYEKEIDRLIRED